VLQPEKDLYGPEADRSNLADYLELLALAGSPMTRADLSDFLVDVTWTVRSRELYVDVAEAEPTEDQEEGGAGVTPQEEWADEIFALCELRGDLLGARYPFLAAGSRLEAKPPDAAHDAYLSLLSITVAHHYKVQLPPGISAEQAFEVVTDQVMAARGLRSANLGELGRAAANFLETVRAAGDVVGVAATPEKAISRKHANDEKVDALSHLDWGDQRGGHWLFIGQSTVGRSGTWQMKMMQPRVHQWEDLMGSILTPLAYLAVPHHVEDVQLLDLIRGDKRMVLDRLRLTHFLIDVPPQAQAIVDAVRLVPPYDPRD
jgi:hypothetical protein